MEDEEDDFGKLLELNTRNSGRDYWYWRDKPEMERGVVQDVLTAAGLKVNGLTNRTQDPPDCEAVIDGQRCGIEVTELVHEKALRRSISKGEIVHFAWTRDDLCRELQSRISRKDRAEKVKGGPYQRYILVIVTDELFLDHSTVENFVADSSFRTKLISDIFLGLSYDPSIGACPVFKLRLSRDSSA